MSIVCWWSGGITSAVACKLAIEKHGKKNCLVILLDTGNEHEDTYRFLKDCEKWYDLPIKKLKSKKYPNIYATWFGHLSLNTATGAVCSYMLKRKVREEWEKSNKFNHQVFGFEFDKKEINRAKALELNHPQTKPLFPLIERKLTKGDCIEFVQSAGLVVPEAYRLGFQNNNCLKTGCVQGGIGYWQKMKVDNPNAFDRMALTEHLLTNIKGQPVTMLKDQSKKAKESGNELVFLKKHELYPNHKTIDDMKGRKVEPLKECNGFCGTNDLNKINQTEFELNKETESHE